MTLVHVEEKEQRAIIWLNRPQSMNALNRPLLEEFNQVLDDIGARRDIRAVLIGGKGGKAFCAGADLKERAGMTAEQTRSFLKLIQGTMNVIENMSQPTVAMIDGFAFGGGLEMALACDFRVFGLKAKVGLTECALGIIPGAGGTKRLSRIVGLSAAKRLIFSAHKMETPEAVYLGLADDVAEEGDVVMTAMNFTEPMLASAPVAVEAAKYAINAGFDCGLAEALTLERRAYETTLYTEDRIEALKAFKEKRPPVFKGA